MRKLIDQLAQPVYCGMAKACSINNIRACTCMLSACKVLDTILVLCTASSPIPA